MATMTAIIAIFLASASYSRTEAAAGVIVPAAGIIQVNASRAGRVSQIKVREGDLVRKGQPLIRIDLQEMDQAGSSTQSSLLTSIERQQVALEAQITSNRAAAASEQRGFDSQIEGLRSELRSLDSQIDAQTQLAEIARIALEQAMSIAARGFMSKRDLATRQENSLLRQQQLSALQQTKAGKLSELNQALQTQKQAGAREAGSREALTASKLAIEREAVTARGDQAYWLASPASGRIAALNMHEGDPVAVQQAIVMVTPLRSKLIAQLYIPGKAVGFIHPMQLVRLALDAYPFDHFGTVRGTVDTVSTAPVMRAEKDGSLAPYYAATVLMEQDWISAYGHPQPLVPGMALTATITVDKRSILGWIFDPLLAAVRS